MLDIRSLVKSFIYFAVTLCVTACTTSNITKPETKIADYVNAIQVYPFTKGALYQVFTAPEQVTDIALGSGERLISVSAGDTENWILGDTLSGESDTEQVHILVKPIKSGLTTNQL